MHDVELDTILRDSAPPVTVSPDANLAVAELAHTVATSGAVRPRATGAGLEKLSGGPQEGGLGTLTARSPSRDR